MFSRGLVSGAPGRVADGLASLASVRGVCFLLGKAAAISAVVFALMAGDTFREARNFRIPEIHLSSEGGHGSTKGAATPQSYNVINTRNLFGAKSNAPAATPPPANTPQLKLRLVGTSIGKRGPLAILEDLNKNEQEVFDLNESIFGRAKLVEILADSARVEYAGRIETLYIDEGGASSGSGDAASADSGGDDQTEFTVAETELSESLANLPLLLSQARAVPYFRNGQSIGMRLFAIRRDSMYEKLGLKNGDILTTVNDNNLSDPSQALKIFEQLKNERSINVKLERNGAEKNLHYSIR